MSLKRFFLVILLLSSVAACDETTSRMPSRAGLIPLPQKVLEAEGAFLVTADTKVTVTGNADSRRVAAQFADLLKRTSHFSLNVSQSGSAGIGFLIDENVVGEEAYKLQVAESGITLRASTAKGLFYGSMTLWQMLTPKDHVGDSILLQAQVIDDAPRFKWRGVMLDSARHYQSKNFIKNFIDWMAAHKLNVFHWHLIDDQAWRLEIKKYPKLTAVGAYRVQQGAGGQQDVDPATGKPRLYGHYYSQEDVREIVAYAADRFVTVVPEIEMPGHAQALLAAYPEYGVTGKAIEIKTDWGVFKNLYNVEEETFAFIEDVLSEAMDLFPSEYIHIGGDEAVKFQWQESERVQERMREFGVETEEELQSYFVRRVEGFLNSHGRKLVGWDEILEGGLSPNATVMSWRGEVGGVEAARHGHDVVMSPGPVLYFDFAQSDLADEPPSRWVPRTQPLAKVYAYDPVPAELTVDEAKHILGVQGNIWTEQMRQEKTVVHAAFPRVAALSELAWSAPEKKDFDSFLKRLTHQLPRYEGLGVAYADSAFQVDVKAEKDPATGGVLVSMASQTGLGEIRYTLDGTDPTVNSPAYTEALKLRLPVTVKAKSFLEGVPLAATTKATYDAATLARREDTDLETCTSGLVIKLEDDDPAKGDRTNFVVDILNPCWIYKGADLTDVVSIEAKIGQLPFNFRLGNYSKKVELPSPVSEHGELRVRLDTCDGEIIAELPVPTSEPRLGLHKVSGSMRPVDGTHDLCLQFTGNKMDPYWAIDWIDLVTGPSAE